MKPEIAIALSGGGYRAALFHLGTLSYLQHLKLENGDTFLSNINTISTISGGTITGLWYMLQYANDNVREFSFWEFYDKLCNNDVITPSIKNLLSTNSQSLIKEMIKSYDRVFFENVHFDTIQNIIDSGHIHHFSANGTDFSNGYAFRFQASRKIVNADPQYNRGIIGNNEHRIPWSIAGKIKLSEILAVSSCFPGGFEPLYFPTDFELMTNVDIQDYTKAFTAEIPLMDGGIVDNQGIEPILLANTQMQYDDERANGNRNFPCHDLIIVSDVSYPKTKSTDNKKIVMNGKFNLHKLDYIIAFIFLLSIIVILFAYYYSYDKIFGFFLCIAIIMFFFRVASFVLKNLLVKYLKKAPIRIDINMVWKYSITNIISLLLNRERSLIHLLKAMLMKPIRQMRYKALYEDEKWKNRRITNTIYELTANYGSWKNKLNKGRIPEWLVPTEEMQKISKIATEMDTTLWFTADDKLNETPEALFACGQYNICMNLLEYINKLKTDMTNTTAAHKYIMQFENQLMDDWRKFKNNPKWLVKYLKESNIKD